MPTYISFTVRILHSIIVSQLVFYGVKDKPTLFPAFEQSSTLIQITFMCSVFCHIGRKLVIVLLTRCLDCCNTCKTETVAYFTLSHSVSGCTHKLSVILWQNCSFAFKHMQTKTNSFQYVTCPSLCHFNFSILPPAALHKQH